MYKRAQKVRLAVVFCLYILVFLIVFIRLFNIQVLNKQAYIKLAESQHYLKLTLYPQRGIIYDRNRKVLVLSLPVFSVYAEPRVIEEKEKTAEALCGILDLSYENVLRRLELDKAFVWIKRRISDADALVIQAKTPYIDTIQSNVPNSYGG